MLNFKFIKLVSVVFIIIYFIIGHSPAFAKFITIYPNQDEENFVPSNGMVAAAIEAIPAKTDGEIADCFDYYRFPSIQTSFETLKEFYEPGQKVYFKGELINENSYPIVDGYLFVRIARLNENYIREGHDIVDEFFANSGPQGREKFYLESKEKKGVVFSWNAPENLPAGVYKATFSFAVGKKMNLAGLSFTNEVIAGSTEFEVLKSAAGAQRVFLEKSSFAVNGKKYNHIGFWPRFGKDAKVEVAGKIRNDTAQKANLKLVYDLYYWDGLDDKNKISSRSEDITVAPDSSRSFKYVIPKMNETVYFLRITAVADNNQKSIVNLRFVSEQEKPRINFFSPTKFPVLAGETMTNFVCFHNTADKSALGKVTMNIFDESGDKIQTVSYEGETTGNIMAVKKNAVAAKNYDYLRIAASVTGTDGRETDSYEMIYDCKNMNPENKECAKIQEEKAMAGASDKPSDKKNIMFGITALAAIVAIAVLLRKFFINKAKPPLISLFFALAVGLAVFLAGGADNRVLAETKTVFSNFSFPEGTCTQGNSGNNINTPYGNICISNGLLVVAHLVEHDGASNHLTIGNKINFTYNPGNPVWFASGGAYDTPDGTWCDDGDSVNDYNCKNKRMASYSDVDESVDQTSNLEEKRNIKMTFLAQKPSINIESSNSNIIKCESMTCEAIGNGSAKITARLGKVTARPWIKFTVTNINKVYEYSVLKEDWTDEKKFKDGVIYDVSLNDATLTWDIAVDPPLPTCTASFSQSEINSGEATTFKWDSFNDKDTIAPITCTTDKYNCKECPSSGYYSISPETTQTCTATVENDKGAATCSATVTVIPRDISLSVSCSANPNPVTLNTPTTFTATVLGGAPDYTYVWSDDVPSKTTTKSGLTDTNSQSYSSVGTKNATIKVTDSSGDFETNTCSVTVDITPPPSGYDLTVNIGGNCTGSVYNKERSDSTNGTKTYTGYVSGDTATLTATPGAYSGETCKMTGGWSTASGGNCDGGKLSKNNTKEDTCELTMGSADKSVSVSFNEPVVALYCGDGACNNGETCSSCSNDCGTCVVTPDYHNLTLKKNGNGSVQLYGWRDNFNDYGETVDSNFQNNETNSLPKNGYAKMTATPDSGSYFSSWSGCTSTSEGKSWTDADGIVHSSTPSSGENACYVTMTGPKTATVTFTSSSGSGGGGGGGGGSSVKAYISAQNTVVTDGNSTVVTWTSDNATSCEQKEGGSDTGWISASDTALGSYTTSNFTTSGGSRTYKVTCTNGPQFADAEVTINVGDYAGSPSVSMWADPQSVGYKKTSAIQWLSSNVFPNTCLLFSAADTMNGYLAYFNFLKNQYFGPGYYNAEISDNNSTGQKTGKLSGNTVYKIQCRGVDSTNIQSQTTVTVAKPVSNFTLTNPTGGSLIATIVEGLSANSNGLALTLNGETIGNVSLSASIPAISGAKAQFATSADNGGTWSAWSGAPLNDIDINATPQIKIRAINIPGATATGTYNTVITATDTGTGGKTKKLNVNLKVNKVTSEWEEF